MSERLLRLRKEVSKKRPKFRRQETWKLKKFKRNPTWRKPRGHSSKMRRKLKGKPSLVRVGYRGPKDVRGLHSCGLPEVYVTNASEVEGVKDSILRISSTVGTRKKAEIVMKATELNLKVANPSIKFLYIDSIDALERSVQIKDYVKEFRIAKVEDTVRDEIIDRAEELKVPIETGE